MNRKDFIKLSVGMAITAPFVNSCKTITPVSGKIVGPSSSLGHILRDYKTFKIPETYEKKKVVIVGAGVSGLSAARHLFQHHVDDFVVLDLEEHVGGNASHGSNPVSKYPWGAHYVPLPNNNLEEYISFLEEADVITGYDEKNLPIYNEYYLCQDPEERLYINGKWQDGLVPQFGLAENELAEFKKFFALMHDFKNLKGRDGKEAFSIPIDTSSTDSNITALDEITMKAWMDQNELTCAYIRWYVNYCTKDDFGTNYDQISAWAGIHYFASRKGQGNNASYHDVLTWEEGNGFLVNQLQKNFSSKVKTRTLITSVTSEDSGVKITYYDVAEKRMKGIVANQCILAVPQFVASRLLKDEKRLALVKDKMHYVPWMVANLTVSAVTERSGQPMSWDNVIYNSASLGYIDATHQQLQQHKSQKTITYYLPLTSTTPESARMDAFKTTHQTWCDKIFDDLKLVHPDIREVTQNIDIMVWAHAMVQPLPGMIHGSLRSDLGKSIHDSVHFAHTDLAGISIFEEGFYRGIAAAKKVMQNG